MAKCGAKTRNGERCKRNAMPNGRCNLHGGKSTGPPKGNRNAVKWGFWSKHVDAEQLSIMREIDSSNPIDILWLNILLAYSGIIRAQKIMFVADEDDHSDFQTKQSSSMNGVSEEHERKWAFDKHANFMQAQARAQSELRSLIKDFLTIVDEKDARRLKIESMQKEIELKNMEIELMRNPDGDEHVDDGFIDALKGRASEVWKREQETHEEEST